MPEESDAPYLSPREQQIMELVYSRDGGLSAPEIESGLGVSNSAARTFLRILEQKGHLRHEEQAGRFVYFPTRLRESAGSSALSRVATTFFGGSPVRLMASLLSQRDTQLSKTELDELRLLIEAAREKGS